MNRYAEFGVILAGLALCLLHSEDGAFLHPEGGGLLNFGATAFILILTAVFYRRMPWWRGIIALTLGVISSAIATMFHVVDLFRGTVHDADRTGPAMLLGGLLLIVAGISAIRKRRSENAASDPTAAGRNPSHARRSEVLRNPARRTIEVVACAITASTVVLSSTPGWAAPHPKPRPTGTATPSPSPSPTPTPTPSPTTSPTPTPTPTASPTTSPTPTPSPTCGTTIAAGTASYCVATFTDIAAGRYPVGARVAVVGAWVMDAIDAARVTLGRDECPTGAYCGAAVTTIVADYTQAPPTPAVDSLIDIYGTVTADRGILADAQQ